MNAEPGGINWGRATELSEKSQFSRYHRLLGGVSSTGPGVLQTVESSADARELLRRIGGGDEAALVELIEKYEKRVYRVAARTCGDAALAEEAAVETFYKIWKSAGGWVGTSSPDTWIFRIAIHTTKDLVRARNRWWSRIWNSATRRAAGSTLPPDVALSHAEQSNRSRDDLQRTLLSLNEDDRALVTLYYWEEMTLAEIAPLLGATADALKMRLARLRKKLARLLEPPDDD